MYTKNETTNNDHDSNYETKWNWGAFAGWMFFSLGNRTYKGFFNLIPIFNVFWIFWTAAHAEQWALKANTYDNPKEFRAVMDSWNRGGLYTLILNIIIYIVTLLFALTILGAMINSLTYQGY